MSPSYWFSSVWLLTPQSDHGVALRGKSCGEEACNKGQQHADANKDEGGSHREDRVEVRDPRQGTQNDVDDQDKDECNTNADHARGKADGDRFRIEDARYVALRGTDGTQNADLLGALQDRDIGDDADHDRGNHERDRHKCDQNIGNGVDDRGHGGHQKLYVVGVVDLILLVGHGGIVGINACIDLLLILKGGHIDHDLVGHRLVDIAKEGEIVIQRGRGGVGGHVRIIDMYSVPRV